MSYIPDCREDENYNEKYLNHDDKEFIKGFDYAVEDALDSFFYNLDSYDWDVDGEDIDLEKILTNHEELCEKLKDNIKNHLESERDEMIVSMIDHYEDDEYAKIRTEVDGKPYKLSERENPRF